MYRLNRNTKTCFSDSVLIAFHLTNGKYMNQINISARHYYDDEQA